MRKNIILILMTTVIIGARAEQSYLPWFVSTISVPPSTNSAPGITSQPAGRTIAVGTDAAFSITATGTATLAYQWRFNAATITGATLASYTRTNVQSSDSGNLDVIVTNSFGAITSATASLTITTNVEGYYASVIIAETGVMYYWKMGEAAGATQCAASVGSIPINVTAATFGQPGIVSTSQSVYFNGTSSFARTASALALTGSTYWIETWWKGLAYDQSDALLAEYSSNGFSDVTGFTIDPNDSASYFSAWMSDCRLAFYRNYLPTGTFHHVVFKFNRASNPDTITYYLDGALYTNRETSSADGTDRSTFGSNVLWFMSRAPGDTLRSAGYLQHVAIYNQLFNSNNIVTHYNARTNQ